MGGRESSREVVICRALPSKVTGAPMKFRVHPLLTWPSGGGWCQGQGGGLEGKGRGMVDELERERKIGTLTVVVTYSRWFGLYANTYHYLYFYTLRDLLYSM